MTPVLSGTEEVWLYLNSEGTKEDATHRPGRLERAGPVPERLPHTFI